MPRFNVAGAPVHFATAAVLARGLVAAAATTVGPITATAQTPTAAILRRARDLE
jgi:hypothetical protein